MESAKVVMSNKGQAIISKPAREGAALAWGEKDGGGVLKSVLSKNKTFKDWTPINPAGVHLTNAELCRPVNLKIKAQRRKSRA